MGYLVCRATSVSYFISRLMHLTVWNWVISLRLSKLLLSRSFMTSIRDTSRNYRLRNLTMRCLSLIWFLSRLHIFSHFKEVFTFDSRSLRALYQGLCLLFLLVIICTNRTWLSKGLRTRRGNWSPNSAWEITKLIWFSFYKHVFSRSQRDHYTCFRGILFQIWHIEVLHHLKVVL